MVYRFSDNSLEAAMIIAFFPEILPKQLKAFGLSFSPKVF